MASRSVSVVLRANVSGFTAEMAKARQSLDDVVKASDKNAQVADTAGGRMVQSARLQADEWSAVGNTLLGVGTVGTAAFGGTVKAAASFEQQMSAVQAATLAGSGEMEQLSEAAKQAGADTAFSATEAAQGIEELAKAGVSTSDIMSGGLAGALDLAAAGGISVQEAAESAASALTQFSLSGEDVPHVADLLAAAAGKAQGGVTEMSQALSQAGLVASGANLSIEETVGTLAAFASNGLLGSDAGTSFKSMLQKLQNPTKESAALMEELGLSLYDSSGNIVGMSDLAGQLQTKLSGMTQAQRDATMAQLFGSDAVRAANVLYSEGADGIQGWIEAVNDSGYAAETAAARQDNLVGSWESFTGSLETLAITIGQNITPILRTMLDAGASVVDWIADLPGPVLTAGTALGGLATTGLLAVGMAAKLGPGIFSLYNSFKALKSANIGSIGSGLKGMAKWGGLATAGIVLIGSAVQANMDDQQRYNSLVDDYAEALRNAGGSAEETARQVTSLHFDDPLVGLKSITNQSGELGKSLRDVSNEYGITLTTMDAAVSGSAAEQQEAFGQIMKAMQDAGASSEEIYAVINALASLAGASDEAEEQTEWLRAGNSMGSELGSQLSEVASNFDEVASSAEDAAEEIYGYLDAQREASGAALDLSDALIGYQDALDKAADSLEENGETLDITTEAGRENKAALDDIASSGWDVVDSLIAQGASNTDLGKSMESTRADFIATAEQMGMTRQEAEDLADEYGLIPDEINTQANLDRVKASQEAIALKGGLDRIPKIVQSVARMLGGGSVRSDADRTRASLQSIRGTYTATVSIATVGKSVALSAIAAVKRAAAGHASGGLIVGPGTGTSDDVPIMASNGEYMIRESATRKNRRLLDMINYGGFDAQSALGLAEGGPVDRSTMTPARGMFPASIQAVSQPISLDGMRLTGTLDLGDGLEGRMDARINSHDRMLASVGRTGR